MVAAHTSAAADFVVAGRTLQPADSAAVAFTAVVSAVAALGPELRLVS